jgi:hypothetical protein
MVEFEYKVIVDKSIVSELTKGKHDLGQDVKIAESKQPIFDK